MTIWVIEWGNGDEQATCGCFSTKAKAEQGIEVIRAKQTIIISAWTVSDAEKAKGLEREMLNYDIVDYEVDEMLEEQHG